MMVCLRSLSLALAIDYCGAASSYQSLRARMLSLQNIVGYSPRTQVTDVAALDLDQQAMEEELFQGRFLKAQAVYRQGGHSSSFAYLMVYNPYAPAKYLEGTQVFGVTPMGGEVSGRLMEDIEWTANTTHMIAKVAYYTSDFQAKSVSCQVGGLFMFDAANQDGCK
jgi:hypothetical protein